MSKAKSIKVRLVSPSGHVFYTTTRNPKIPKLKLRKFNKETRQYEEFEEKKIK